jgi:hypothetical protein
MIGQGLSTYVLFKVFGIFRDRMVPLVDGYRRDQGGRGEFYQHVFLAPESYSKKRAFQVKGVLSPFVCLWASSPLTYAKGFYSRSVLPVDFEYSIDGSPVVDRGFLYDYEQSFELSSSSYFADFRGAVNQDILDLDRLRYVSLNVDELLPGFSCVAEVMLDSVQQRETVDESGGNRSFDLGAKYTVRVTLPVLSRPELYVDKVNVFLNGEVVWRREVSEVPAEVA